MGSTSFENLQPGDERVYEALAEAMLTEMLELVNTLKPGAGMSSPPKQMRLERFQKFMDAAEGFGKACCERAAKIMRQCAVVPEVRGTPTVVLAREIKTEVFEFHEG